LDVLDVVAENDLILASGHVTPYEAKIVFSEARTLGIRRMVVTHVTAPITNCDEDDIRDFMKLGATAEICARNVIVPETGALSEAAVRRALRILEITGPNGAVLSSDLGDARYPMPWDGLKKLVGALKLKHREVTSLVSTMPRQLLCG